MRRVQDSYGDARQVAFPRRVVTRPVSAFEDHETATVSEFDEMLAAGGFAFWWTAHGLKYGLSAALDDDIRAGRCVVCNISRTVIPELRNRYERLVVVLVTAPHEILAARLAARARATDGDLPERVRRSAEIGPNLDVDIVIDNTGSIDEGARRLQNAIESQLVVISL